MNGITDLFHSENEYYDNQRVTGFVQGTVVENNNADFKGMVKVEFTVWESGRTCVNGCGCCLLTEVQTMVCIVYQRSMRRCWWDLSEAV